MCVYFLNVVLDARLIVIISKEIVKNAQTTPKRTKIKKENSEQQTKPKLPNRKITMPGMWSVQDNICIHGPYRWQSSIRIISRQSHAAHIAFIVYNANDTFASSLDHDPHINYVHQTIWAIWVFLNSVSSGLFLDRHTLSC